MAIFGLKSGQDYKDKAAHSYQEFLGLPPGIMHGFLSITLSQTFYCCLCALLRLE